MFEEYVHMFNTVKYNVGPSILHFNQLKKVVCGGGGVIRNNNKEQKNFSPLAPMKCMILLKRMSPIVTKVQEQASLVHRRQQCLQ